MELFRISDNLYQSPTIDDRRKIKEAGIQVVIDMEGGLDPIRDLGLVAYLYWPITDGNSPPREQLDHVALFGSQMLETGSKVLSHSAAGINRASLVTGRILMLLGFSAKDAIEQIRKNRPGALTNENFVKMLYLLEL